MKAFVESLKRIYFQENDRDTLWLNGDIDKDPQPELRVTPEKLDTLISQNKITKEDKEYIMVGVVPKSEWYPEYIKEKKAEEERLKKEYESARPVEPPADSDQENKDGGEVSPSTPKPHEEGM